MPDHPLYLVRHAETVWNRAGIYQGREDSPLTLLGFHQALAVGRRLLEEPIDWRRATVACSTAFRCRQTAAVLSDAMGLDPIGIAFDERLRERCYGVWEGLTEAEIAARFEAEWKAGTANPWNHAPSGGESFAEVAARVGSWLAERPQGRPLLVVAHGGSGRVLRGLWLGMDGPATLTLHRPHTSVFRLDGEGMTELRAEPLLRFQRRRIGSGDRSEEAESPP